MSGSGSGSGCAHDPGDLSWTNEELPIEVRRALLDKALEELKAARAVGRNAAAPAASDRPGKAGSERATTAARDKPKA
jgi:hypothetical protein